MSVKPLKMYRKFSVLSSSAQIALPGIKLHPKFPIYATAGKLEPYSKLRKCSFDFANGPCRLSLISVSTRLSAKSGQV